ncbi:hypothetical protein [Ammoniphilus sp. 3BR4]|uniref:hypothetical protein n=1 Tax=Ammoniphilus sp. 3BR4 TaxID=3158265 RepID=UPI003467C915
MIRLKQYGRQMCVSCSLTVASFLNGGLYSTPESGLQSYHHECFLENLARAKQQVFLVLSK